MRPFLLLLPEPRFPKHSKSHSQLERGRNSNINYLIQFALQLHYLPPPPRVAQTTSDPWTPIAMEEKAAVAVVDRGGGCNVKGSLGTLDFFG